MAFSRNQMVVAVAGTLSLAVLTGCPQPAAVTPSPSAPATGTATPAPVASPTAAAGTPTPAAGTPTPAAGTPSPAGSPGAATPTPAPSTSAPPPSGKKAIVSGFVYDEKGATVSNAVVTIKSLDASVPYSATATTAEGAWVVNDVPEGANIEIIATKDGWTKRRQVTSIQTSATIKNEVNFGSAGTAASTDKGASHFISDYPEIEKTEPESDKTGVDVTKVSYKMKVSEPLSATSRQNLLRMIRIIPANTAAGLVTAAANTPIDYEGVKSDGTSTSDGIKAADNSTAATVNAFAIADTDAELGTNVLKDGSTFLGSTSNRASGTWNAEGTELTFTFNASLLTSKNADAKYQVLLVSLDPAAASKDNRVEDATGKQLGTKADGTQSGYELAGQFVYNAFKEVDLSADNAKRWVSTHDSVVNFETLRDETAPKLQSVAYTKDIDGDSRIELTFSEPMAAFNGTSRGASSDQTLPQITNANGTFVTANGASGAAGALEADTTDRGKAERALERFQFVASTKIGGTDQVELKSTFDGTEIALSADADVAGNEAGAGITYTTMAANTPAGGEFTISGGGERTFRFDGDNLSNDQDRAEATASHIVMEVDKDRPSTIFIWLKGRKDFFANDVRELKAYVQDIADPAGNKINETSAKASQVKGAL